MSKLKINLCYIDRVLGIVGGTGDFDDTRSELQFWNDVPNLNERVKQVVDKYMVPYLLAWDDDSRLNAKMAIAYVLTFSPDSVKAMFNSHVVSFHAPEPASLLFKWLWEGVFPHESWQLAGNASDYDVFMDRSAPPPNINPAVKVPNPVLGPEFADFQPSTPPR